MLLVELYWSYGQLKTTLHPLIKTRQGLLGLSSREYATGTSGTGSWLYSL